MTLLQVQTLFHTLCLLVALFSLRNEQTYKELLKKLAGFIFLALVVEGAGFAIVQFFKAYNLWLYNIFTLIEFLFYYFIYEKVLRVKRHLQIARFFQISYPIVFSVNFIFFQDFLLAFQSYSYMYGVVGLIALVICWFLEQFLEEENINKTLIRNPFFWITTGLLFYYCGSFLTMITVNYIYANNRLISKNLYQIVYLLNILMYTLISLGYLCRRIFRK